MKIDDCYQLGYVVKTHGTKGAVVIFLDVDEPSEYYEMESVFIQKGNELVPFFIEQFEQTNQPDKLITYFEEVETIEQATALKSSKLFLPIDFLPELKDQQFYYHDIIGFKVVDENLGEVGTVNTVQEMQTTDMFVVDIDGVEVMIPIQEPIYQKIDKSKETVFVDLPDGYLDVFLSDPNKKEDEV